MKVHALVCDRGVARSVGLVVLGAALLACALPRAARADQAISLTPSATQPYYVCPQGPCQAIVVPAPVHTAAGTTPTPAGAALEGSGENGDYSPEDLRSAYNIPASGGAGQTVALVDSGGYPQAEADLAKYRERYGLAPCTKENGCFKVVNQEGNEAPLPVGDPFAASEQAIDVDMVSAVCPECHILLIQANVASEPDLAASANEAAALGATEISNSYGFSESNGCGGTGCTQYLPAYNHPGVEVVAAAGDSGYVAHGVAFPAASPNVIAVGGTALRKARNSRGWTETVWEEAERKKGTGSGCSEFEAKPSWQTDKGCPNRTDNDVAAVASCETPVSFYDHVAGWVGGCGTSVGSPLIAGILAHSNSFTRSLGAEVFYQDPGMLFDVIKGANGECGDKKTSYLCTAKRGYDGPTGLGAPDGVIEATGS